MRECVPDSIGGLPLLDESIFFLFQKVNSPNLYHGRQNSCQFVLPIVVPYKERRCFFSRSNRSFISKKLDTFAALQIIYAG